jgi:NADH-quinone oxidoreductase subunit A
MASDAFWPIVLHLALVLVVVAVMIVMPSLLGERHSRKPWRRGERGTAQAYESGIAPTGNAQLRIPLQYYLVAMLFVIFDLEAVYLYSWALVAREAGWVGFIEAAVFIALLMVALIYLWRVGALDWKRRARLPGRRAPQTAEEKSRAVA